MKKRVTLNFMVFIVFMNCSCGVVHHYDIWANDEFSRSIKKDIDSNVGYHGKEEYDDGVTSYTFEMKTFDADSIADFVNIINDAYTENETYSKNEKK